ncbi:MAG: hypothetical protein HQL22_05060 [Candidatus Omnitrophica bacterium]|nr:hypothetical protein [Candidatus Omnitrophota bacterium]
MKIFHRLFRHRTFAAFSALVLIELLFLFWDISARHIVIHDPLAFFFGEYYRLNAIVEYGQVSLWTPFLTHGSRMFYLNGPGFLFDAFFFMWKLLRFFDFLSLFYVGMFFYHFVFLSGVWLLSGRYFAALAPRLFVMVCVASCMISYNQMFWICILYVVPLVIWLLYRFLDSGQWRWFFLAAYFFGVQSLETNPYTITVSLLAVFVLYVFDICIRREYYEKQFKLIKFGASFRICVLSILALAALILVNMRLNMDPFTIFGNYLRNPDGTVSLQTFLTYAGNTHLNKWNELALRLSPALDFTLYMGLFALPCVLAALCLSPRKEAMVWIGWTVAMLLLTMGSVLAVVLYYFWPLMNYYRHLCLLAPVVKFGLCFLAGFGFEAIFCADNKRVADEHWRRSVFFFFTAVFFMGVTFFLCQLRNDAVLRDFILGEMVTGGLPSFDWNALNFNFYIPIFISGVLAIFCTMMIFIRTQKALLIIGVLWFLAQMIDVYAYRVDQSLLRTVSVSQKDLKSLTWQPLPWRASRNCEHLDTDDRIDFLAVLLQKKGAIYNSAGNFLWRDCFSTVLRTDTWAKPLDYYLRAYMHIPLNASGNINAGTPYSFNFNLNTPSVLKISGVTKDKVQFFTSAVYFSSPQKAADVIADPGYAGDVPVLTSYDGQPTLRMDDTVSSTDLGLNSRLDLPYHVKLFSPNEVVIETVVPVGRPVWLLYSDIWHPSWRAEVNTKSVPVYVANLAYKAVPLAAGKNTVRFYFYSSILTFLFWFSAAQGFMAFVIFLWLLADTIFKDDAKDRELFIKSGL